MRKYYCSLILGEKYQMQAEDEVKNNVFITYLNQSFSALILQGLERLLVPNLSAAPDHCSAFIETISYYQDNQQHGKKERVDKCKYTLLARVYFIFHFFAFILLVYILK